MMEKWKTIKGYSKNYKVSNHGRVISCKRRKDIKLRGWIHKHGYPMVALCRFGKKKNFFVHRLVAEAFIPNINDKPFINHKNGIKTDNRVENLEWCTQKENMQHAHKNGLINNDVLGEKNPSCKLTKEVILSIRKEYKGDLSQTDLAKKYDVSQTHICDIVNNNV